MLLLLQLQKGIAIYIDIIGASLRLARLMAKLNYGHKDIYLMTRPRRPIAAHFFLAWPWCLTHPSVFKLFLQGVTVKREGRGGCCNVRLDECEVSTYLLVRPLF